MDIRDAFFDELYEITSHDKNLMFLTADMGAFGLNKFKRDFPKQYINVGVAEQNLISVGAGLALSGKRVFLYAIAAFLIYRALDQIRIDICEMNLPVTLIGAGPGLTYHAEGPTHHALYDDIIISMFPNIKVFTPRTPEDAQTVMILAYLSKSPVYIRLGRGEVYDEFY